MAIRYSGDVEVRIQYKGDNFYIALIRTPDKNIAVRLRQRFLFRKPNDSQAYDAIAREAIHTVLERTRVKLPLELDEFNRIVIRRVFQSPCPM